jgi:hypothetical protein
MIVRSVVRRVPGPGTVVTEPNIDTARPVVTRHEPPDVGVVVPPRVHENIVDPFHHAVAVDPNVVTVRIRPMVIDPDPVFGTRRLLDHDGLWRRRRFRRRRDGLGLLNDDHRFTIDHLGGAVLRLDDDVHGFVVGLDGCRLRMPVPVVGHLVLVGRRVAVAVGAVVVGEGRVGEDRDRQRGQRPESDEGIHGTSNMCTSASPRRHPQSPGRAQPARQNDQKVLGLRRFRCLHKR